MKKFGITMMFLMLIMATVMLLGAINKATAIKEPAIIETVNGSKITAIAKGTYADGHRYRFYADNLIPGQKIILVINPGDSLSLKDDTVIDIE